MINFSIHRAKNVRPPVQKEQRQRVPRAWSVEAPMKNVSIYCHTFSFPVLNLTSLSCSLSLSSMRL